MPKDIQTSASEVISVYCDLMTEVKIRAAAITAVVSGPFKLIPAQVLYELCYLQLRMICELIALACLVAHGDIDATKTKKLQKAYSADFITGALEKLHPAFYPRPSRQIVNDRGGISVEEITADYLSKAEFKRLYGECGDILHRGNIRNMKGHIRPKSVSFAEIHVWLRKIITLLNHHQISLSTHPDYELWFLMEAKHDKKVYGHLMKKVSVFNGK